MKQSTGDHQPPFHAARQILHFIVDPFLQFDILQQFLNAMLSRGRRDMMQAAMQIQIFAHRQIHVQVKMLRHNPQHRLDALCIDGQRTVADANLAGSRSGQHRQHANDRCFACPVRPEQTEYFSCGNLQVQPIDCRPLAKFFHQLSQLNHGVPSFHRYWFNYWPPVARYGSPRNPTAPPDGSM